MGDKTKGLFGKFRVVERVDGSHAPGKKHDGCRYFVLDVDHDPHAIPALQAYARSARKDGYDLLSSDLEAMVGGAESLPTGEAGAGEWGNVPMKGDWYVPGWYFQRRKSNGALQIVEINYHGLIWRIGASNTKFVVELKETGDYEWLGPISHESINAATEPAD